MALYLCLNKNGSSAVTDDNPISTKHTNAGNAQTVEVYIANDGKRKGVQNDNPNKEKKLIYTNIQIRVEGVSHTLEKDLTSSSGDATLVFDKIDGWNIGTIIYAKGERMRIDSILTDKSVSVQRNYTADNKQSFITNHPIKTNFIAEATSVALALPSPDNENTNGRFKAGGEPITEGLDPSYLSNSLEARDTDKTVRSNNINLYEKGSVIKIGNEKMKIVEATSTELTVVRGFEKTPIESHPAQSIIYCVGIVDIEKGHKFYIQNTPPAGLPTQKKSDIKITLLSDEEPL